MKCPICNRYYSLKKEVLVHMDSRHFDQIPENMSTAKYYYALNHGGQTTGKCRVCSDPTQFDEATGRTKVLCDNPKCKEQFAKIAQERNIKKYGVPHLLNDQEHQMKMLSRRKISGEYKWSDGKTRIPYVGSYERRFLEFLDNFLSFDPSTIYAPCPVTFQYEYDGETLSHTPDFFIDILNLVVEIKHGGKNPNKHPKIQNVDVKKDKAKEEALRRSTDYNYIKITDNDFKPFMKFLFKFRENDQGGKKERFFIVNESSLEESNTQYLSEFTNNGDIMEQWLHDMERSAKTMFNMGDFEDLYIHFFGTQANQDSMSFIGDIDFAITFQDNKKNLVEFHDGVFRLVEKERAKELRKKFFVTYKYVGEIRLDKYINNLKEVIKSGKKFEEDNELNALAEVFPILFTKDKKNYNILDITMNPDFIKYTKPKAVKLDFDPGFLNLIR